MGFLRLPMKPNRPLLKVHLAVLLFGLAGLFGKWLAFSPLVIVLGRVVLASLALAAALGFLRQTLWARKVKDLALFAVMGLILAVHWTTFFTSIQVSTVAVGLLAYSTFPFFTAFLEPIWLKERVDKRSVLLSLVCLAGVFLIIPRLELSNAVVKGVLWGLLSGFSFSLLAILNRKMTRTYSSLRVAFHQDFFAMVFLAPFVFHSPPALSGRDILGIVCTAGAHTLFIDGLKGIGARAASLISTLEPVYGVILAFAFLKEVPAVRTLLGGVLILAAVAAISLLNDGRLRPGRGRPV
jgi:drug/metabolite transporter (DMT)-like permease